MLWMWMPILLLIVVACAWIAVAAIRRRGGSGRREEGEVLYDRETQRKSPDAPPA